MIAREILRGGELRKIIDAELDFVRSTLLLGLHPEEIKNLTNAAVHMFSITNLYDLSKETFKKVKEHLCDEIVGEIKKRILLLTSKEKTTRFHLPTPKHDNVCGIPETVDFSKYKPFDLSKETVEKVEKIRASKHWSELSIVNMKNKHELIQTLDLEVPKNQPACN